MTDEAALAAAHSASLCPREATLTFKGWDTPGRR